MDLAMRTRVQAWSRDAPIAVLPPAARPLPVEVDGQPRAGASCAEDVTDPVSAVKDLLTSTPERLITLPQSLIVSTGSQSVPLALEGCARVAGRCGSGRLEFSIVPGEEN